MSETAPLLRVQGLSKNFGLRRTLTERITRQQAKPVRAVDGVSLTLSRADPWQELADRRSHRAGRRAALPQHQNPPRHYR